MSPISSENVQFVAFVGDELLHRGPLVDVVLAAKERHDQKEKRRVALFDESTGRPFDVDFRGSAEGVIARLAEHPVLGTHRPITKRHSGPGRPKLGVVSREVSLLPRHWDWLEAQRGSASATLRRLVDLARKNTSADEITRAARDAAYSFMSDIAGSQPGFEEASRALFAGDFDRFHDEISSWPEALRDQLHRFTARAQAQPRGA